MGKIINEKHTSNIDHLAKEYQSNDPFPHIVIDNFLNENIADKILKIFPDKSKFDLAKYQTQENKVNYNPSSGTLSIELENYLNQLNSYRVLGFLEQITGIQALLPDPTFIGGGLHETFDGGKLGIHVDFNRHRYYGLHRRMNLILFLNKSWDEKFGGALELWDKKMEKCEKKVYPLFNRAVIFNTTDDSYHGHPDPMKLPTNFSRKSVALYYYTSDRNDNAKEVFWTEHQKRPGKKDYKFKSGINYVFSQITPPIITRVINKLK